MMSFNFMRSKPKPAAGPARMISIWRKVFPIFAAAVIAILFFKIWTRYDSRPENGDNAKVTWGVMCRDGQCRPAALLHGVIPASAEPVLDLLASRPDVQTLCLDSRGGNAWAAARLSAWLIEHNYDTCLPQFGSAPNKLDAVCASACTRVFVAGRRRYMAPEASFQIHRGAIPWLRRLTGAPSADSAGSSVVSELARVLEPVNTFVAKLNLRLSEVGMPQSIAGSRLLEEAEKTPSYQLRTVSPDKLLEWGVLTEPAIHAIVFKKDGPKP